MAICKWCGKKYNKKHNRQEYCNEQCSYYARLEQKAKYNRKYRRTYPLDEKTKYGLGSGGLGQHPHEDTEVEIKQIKKEKKRIGLKT